MKCDFKLFRASAAALPVALLLQTLSLFWLQSSAFAETLLERQARVLEVVKRVSPAVVAISGRNGVGRLGSGSGVIISKDGYILTAGHVLAATGDDLEVTLPDGREVKARALGRNMNRDAALAKITDPGEWPFVEMASPDGIEQGEWVLAMGHPGGYDVSRGAPLRIGRLWEADAKAYFRSDCTVSGGDSGGPLFDLDGRVVGIHSSISQNLSENRHVPIGVFHQDMERLKKGDRWGKLSTLMPEMRDYDRAHGDETNDEAEPPRREREPQQPRGLRRFLQRDRGGDNAEKSRGESTTPPASGRPWLGLKLENARQGGVMVVEVSDGSPAAKAGLQLEDVILKVNGNAINRTADIVGVIESAKVGDTLNLTVRRDNRERQVAVKLEPAP